MLEPSPNFNLKQVAVVGLIAGILLHACVAYSVLGGNGDGAETTSPSATVVVQADATVTPTPLPHRTDCAQIRADPVYQSEAERTWFLENCV